MAILLPEEGNNLMGQTREAWNLNVNFIWYPGRTGRQAPFSRYRPLFDVADNTSFMLNRIP